ncbi:MAG: carboxypeptidase regulatory-like domain-containing protein [bacterium]|nr:carboxypeptidase regulatory-like domain-containing protein [bacterium]
MVLLGIFLVSNGYCGLQYEKELAQKFCPSLQLHSGDQGVAPKPVEIMSNGRVDGITSFLDENDLYCRTFNVAGELVGDFDANDSGWELYTINAWPPGSIYYDTIYGKEPFKIGGRPPGCASGVYFVFFHYDFGGSGRNSPDTWYQDYHNLSGLYNDTIYAHVFASGDKAVIQYWFFYPFNDWVNNHEGDWEHINVVVSSQDPATAQIEYVDYYFHHYVKSCAKPGIDFFVDDTTHPVVFVGGHGAWKPPVGGGGSGEGSHGSYPVKGHWDDVQDLPKVCEDIDGSGEFLSYKTFGLKMIPNRDEVSKDDKDLYWMRVGIPWGHRECNSPGDWSEPITKHDVGNNSPRGPNFKEAWNDTGDTSNDEYKWYLKLPPYSPVTNSGYTIPKVGIIKGKVTDKTSGNPIVGATIKVSGRNRSATTDKDGMYKIALPVGSYKLYCSKSRYGGRSKEIVVNEEAELVADFSLFLTQYTFTPSNIWIESQQELNKWALGSVVYLKVKRYEVRAKITFPQEFIEPPDVLQIQTNGLSGANPNKGSTWADVISISNKEAIVRTFVYWVGYNIAGESIKRYIPCAPGNTSFNVTLEGYVEQPDPVSISGKAIKSSTGNPVIARVEILKRNAVKGSSSTNNKGEYSISNLLPGTYIIRIIQDGTILKTQEIELYSDTLLNFDLPDYIYGGNSSLNINVESRSGKNYTYYLYPSDPGYKIYNWGYSVHYSIKGGRDDGSYVDYANNRLVIKVRLDGQWYRKSKYGATYNLYGRKEVLDIPPISEYEGDNSLRVTDSSSKYEVKTYYLYPSDPKYKIYKWDYEAHEKLFAKDYGTDIDPVNNRLVIKVGLSGFTWRFWWFSWVIRARYDATYKVYGRLSDSKEPKALSQIPVTLVEEKREQRKPHAFFQKTSGLNKTNEMTVSIMLKDVEDEIREGKIRISFDPARIDVKDVVAPVFEEEGQAKTRFSEGTSSLQIFLHSEIDNNTGKVNIEVAIVPDDDTEEISYGTTTSTSTTQSIVNQASDKKEENIAPIAYLTIKLDSNRGMSAIQEDDILSLLSIDSLELTDSQGERIEVDVDNDESKTSPPKTSELLQSYPNPAGDSCYIPFKLSADSNVTVEIYNILGQKVRTIDAGPRKAGSYTKQDRAIFWDRRNDSGERVASGLYYINLKLDKFSATKAMVVR